MAHEAVVEDAVDRGAVEDAAFGATPHPRPIGGGQGRGRGRLHGLSLAAKRMTRKSHFRYISPVHSCGCPSPSIAAAARRSTGRSTRSCGGASSPGGWPRATACPPPGSWRRDCACRGPPWPWPTTSWWRRDIWNPAPVPARSSVARFPTSRHPPGAPRRPVWSASPSGCRRWCRGWRRSSRAAPRRPAWSISRRRRPTARSFPSRSGTVWCVTTCAVAPLAAPPTPRAAPDTRGCGRRLRRISAARAPCSAAPTRYWS